MRYKQAKEMARETNDIRIIKRVLVDVAESNYKLRDRWRYPRTTLLTHAECLQMRPRGRAGSNPKVSFSCCSTADAMKYFAARAGTVVSALNFANGESVGGGYKNGAIAQEEDLCRRCPCLYTSLNNAKRDGFYPFGPATYVSATNPGRYSDVLVTPNVVLARGGEETGFALWPDAEQVSVNLVTAAAPNVTKGIEVFDKDLAYKTVQAIFIAPVLVDPKVNTLILGAWGCGVFGCKPDEICELFVMALRNGLGELYNEIHFAIMSPNGEDVNTKLFKQTLQRHRINFSDM
jgi:uncharacterized protein (TIGR02452 family)